MRWLQDLTPRGRTVVVLGIGSLVSGRVLALRELYMVAAAMFSLAGIAFGIVLWRRGILGVRRVVTPDRTVAGSEIRVELTVANRGHTEGSHLLLEDRLPTVLNTTARLALSSVPSGQERKLAYVLKARVRGRYTLGPLQVARTDPFGLVMRKIQLPGQSNAIVYPYYEPLTTMPQNVRKQGAVRRSPLIGEGEEFYALRPYQQGDDLRRVHWPTSMRRRELLVKQHELVREPSVLIILDSCAAKHHGTGATASIEAAVSACAAVAILAMESSMPLQIYSADGRLVAGRRPSSDELLEALAVLPSSPKPSLGDALSAAVRAGAGGASMFCVTPGLSPRELAGIRDLASRATGGATIFVDAPTFATVPVAGHSHHAAQEALRSIGLPVLRLSSSDNFRESWESMARSSYLGSVR